MSYIINVTHIISEIILFISILIFLKSIFAAGIKNHKIKYLLIIQDISKKTQPNKIISLIDYETNKLIANIESFPCIIGKGKNANIIISNNKFISKRHIVFTFEKNIFFIQDLESANGTWLNGVKLTSKRAIENGDKIRIGHETLKIVIKRKNKSLSGEEEKNIINVKKKIS